MFAQASVHFIVAKELQVMLHTSSGHMFHEKQSVSVVPVALMVLREVVVVRVVVDMEVVVVTEVVVLLVVV